MVKWYVIRTATNKEKECKDKIENELRHTDLNNYIKQIVVPLEKTIQLRKGKQIITTRNHYPGYILIETDILALPELSVIFKGVKFVIGFLGKDNPIALKPKEIETILGRMDELQGQTPIVLNSYMIGETVKVIDGPFKDFIGKVSEYYKDKNKLKVNVAVFGRETPIDLNILQVTKEI